MTDQLWMHKALCQRNEITARNAANITLREERNRLQEEKDILEEGLRDTERRLVEMQKKLGAALVENAKLRHRLEFPHDAETVQADPGD